jgi:hypothetical protein
MRKMIFKSQSRLEVIEPSSFEDCRFERIGIPRTIEHLTQLRFSNSTIVTSIFESTRQIRTIEDSYFLKYIHYNMLHYATKYLYSLFSWNGLMKNFRSFCLNFSKTEVERTRTPSRSRTLKPASLLRSQTIGAPVVTAPSWK